MSNDGYDTDNTTEKCYKTQRTFDNEAALNAYNRKQQPQAYAKAELLSYTQDLAQQRALANRPPPASATPTLRSSARLQNQQQLQTKGGKMLKLYRKSRKSRKIRKSRKSRKIRKN